MKQWQKIAIPIGVTVLGAKALQYVDFNKNYSLSANSFKFTTSGTALILEFNAAITNNSNKEVVLSSVSGQIYHNNRLLTTYRADGQVKAAAGATTNFPVKARITAGDSLRNLSEVVNSPSQTVTIVSQVAVQFDLLLGIGVPVYIKSTDRFDLRSWFSDIKDTYKKWVEIFQK